MAEIDNKLLELDAQIQNANSVITESEKTFKQLNSKNLQGTLIQIEDFLDNLHMFTFRNWIEGTVYDGPDVSRHWVKLKLSYNINEMPDPRGAQRLVSAGVVVSWKKTTIYVPADHKDPNQIDPVTGLSKNVPKRIWVIGLKIPRHFIQDAVEDFPDYDDVSADDVNEQKIPQPSDDNNDKE